MHVSITLHQVHAKWAAVGSELVPGRGHSTAAGKGLGSPAVDARFLWATFCQMELGAGARGAVSILTEDVKHATKQAAAAVIAIVAAAPAFIVLRSPSGGRQCGCQA